MRFEEDRQFLQQHGEILRLSSPGGGQVLVSPQYQGRVMTSAVRADAESLGWLNRPFISAGKTGTPFDNFGGEDRLWLGPEGGQFAIFFAPNAPFEYANWQVPHALQEGRWNVVEQSASTVLFDRDLELTNYSGHHFSIQIRRRITLLDAASVKAALGLAPPSEVEWVAFESDNTLTNTGKGAWTPEKGLLSLWSLSQFQPTPDTQVIIPYDVSGTGPIVCDNYFGKVPADRLKVLESHKVLKFKCDGLHRSKIGLGPKRAGSIAGSYSAGARLLTLAQFNRNLAEQRYVNSLWELQQEPYAGDVINSYNDGPVQPGQASQGGFYELETSSPAIALAPGATMRHLHRTLHFVGDQRALNPIVKATLGCALDQVYGS